MEFNRNRLMDNINTLIKEKGMKIGEVETSVGISTGYLSKMSKAENESTPGVDLIYKLAEKLEVSMDALVGGDFKQSNDNLLYLVKFLHELTYGTNIHEINWERFKSFDSIKDAADLPNWTDMDVSLSTGFDDAVNTRDYVSAFAPHRILKPTEENFYAFVDTLNVVMIFKCIETVDGQDHVVYELYSATDNGPSNNYVIPICSTLENEGALFFALSDFYECILKHDKDIKISESARRVIGEFLCRNNTEDLPFA